MSTITQAVDWLLAGLLLPTTRLLWIHGLFKMVVRVWLPFVVCRPTARQMGRGIESNAPDQSKLGSC
jgi:hypothetical protein